MFSFCQFQAPPSLPWAFVSHVALFPVPRQGIFFNGTGRGGGGGGLIPALCPFFHSYHNLDFHQNPSKLCITEKLIACKFQNGIFQCSVSHSNMIPGSPSITCFAWPPMHLRKFYVQFKAKNPFLLNVF